MLILIYSPSLLAHKHTNTHNYVQMHAPHSHTGTPPSELVIALALDATLTAAAHANMIAAANKSIYVLKHGDGKNAGILPVGMNVVIREVYMKECSESNDLAPMRALINALSHETPGASSKDCPCLESSKVFSALNTSGYVDGNGNIVLEGVPQPLYLTDRDGRKRGAVYGGDSCMSHDQQLPPSCADATGIPLANAPAWCLRSWCFVDTASCDRTNTLSAYFPAAKLMYSYDTCGSEDLYSKVSNKDRWVGLIALSSTDLTDHRSSWVVSLACMYLTEDGVSSFFSLTNVLVASVSFPPSAASSVSRAERAAQRHLR